MLILRKMHLPETLMEVPASITPLFGRTQYRRGAVVFTLKHTFLSVGLASFRVVVTTSVNGPEGRKTGHSIVTFKTRVLLCGFLAHCHAISRVCWVIVCCKNISNNICSQTALSGHIDLQPCNRFHPTKT